MDAPDELRELLVNDPALAELRQKASAQSDRSRRRLGWWAGLIQNILAAGIVGLAVVIWSRMPGSAVAKANLLLSIATSLLLLAMPFAIWCMSRRARRSVDLQIIRREHELDLVYSRRLMTEHEEQMRQLEERVNALLRTA